MMKTLTLVLCCVCSWTLLTGCEAPPDPEPQIPQDFLQSDWQPQEVPVARVVRREYRVRPGDFLEIIYHVRHRMEPEAYRIKIQDVIVVRFPFNPALTQEAAVQSDGTLRLDLIGSVMVYDRTIEEVQREVQERYSTFLKDPELTVSFRQSNVNITELREAIRTAPRGQSRLVPVAPDGRISLPFILDVSAAGKTVGELHRALNSAYQAVGLPELEVTVNLQTIEPLRVYVLGEVRNPGVVLDQVRVGTTAGQQEMTLLQAIAQAGGYLNARAELSQVVLVRRRNLPTPQAAVVNVYQMLHNRTKKFGQSVKVDALPYRHDIYLEDGDIIYVPSTEIARRADFIELVWVRGIRAVMGTTTSINYTAGDSVDWLGPTP